MSPWNWRNKLFPNFDMRGFSPRNSRFMVQFAKEYPNIEIRKQLVSQIPWGHNIILIWNVKILLSL